MSRDSENVGMDSNSRTDDGGSQANATSKNEQTLASEAVPATAPAEQPTAVVESAATVAQATSSSEDASDAPDSGYKELQSSNHRKGLIDETTEFINDHIRIFRLLPWVIGGVGVGLLVRFYPRMVFRRYQRPSDVHRQLIENNVRLTGIVAMTGWNSLGVWHVPQWRHVLRIRHQPIG